MNKVIKKFHRNFTTTSKSAHTLQLMSSGTWPDQDLPTYSLSDYLAGTLKAQRDLYSLCRETPLQFAPLLSQLTGNNIFLKREDMQPVFSFKLRGAFNKINSLTQEQRNQGVVTCSAGNHAQGVALSSRTLGIDNLILMPKGTPEIKVSAVRKFGGNVLLYGDNFDEAQEKAIELSETEGKTLIHPFDDYHVISGQGTIAAEILKQFSPASTTAPEIESKRIDEVYCCVGGGGLIAGVLAYVSQLDPQIRVVGCETFDANSLTKSLEEGKRVTLDSVGLFADGAAVKTVGKLPFEVSCQAELNTMVNVTTDDICQSVKLVFQDTRTILEPAGALSVAGMLKRVREEGIKGKNLVCVASGANFDFDRLRFVAERADVSEHLLHVKIPEKPGAFNELYSCIYPRNVTEFSYRRNPVADSNGKLADVILSFQVKQENESKEVMQKLSDKNFEVFDYQENELAKTHVRHLAAGRTQVPGERLISFEFPERPGALKMFLDKIYQGNLFDVSLFHYRNHGSDIGRVLVGVVVPEELNDAFQSFLNDLGFSFSEETENPAYRNFLQ
eukprot:maker-scaffold_91-snap-gene-0.41-mRNA-1 protein AED:0.02 eAED:0.02 QI:92/1/1/1/1/1/3/53/558